MKKSGVLLLVLLVFFNLFPQAAFAAENASTDKDFTAYLNDISVLRGITVREDELDYSLIMNGKTQDDFQTTEEVISFLGEVINKDLSNLSDIYNKYNMNQAELIALLEEYGEGLEDYIFINDLDASLAFYTDNNEFEREEDFDIKLSAYLAEVSAVRGFEVTEEYVNSYLSEYYSSIDDFETVEELSDFLGDVIKKDLSNLDYFIEYDLDEEHLLQLLENNGKNINDFVYMYQIEDLLLSLIEEEYPEFDLSVYMEIFNQIGITEAEISNLENHFLKITDYISSPEGQAQMEDIATRMLAFSQSLFDKSIVDENYQPSDAEIAEFAALYEELLTNLKLKVVVSIVSNGVEKQYTIEELMKMNEIKDADYKLGFYNDASELLLDAVFTSEFINTNFGSVIEDINNEIIDTKNNEKPVQTVKGGELPKTAANYVSNAIVGLCFIIFGVILLMLKVRTDKSETNKNEIH
ncbi:MAG: hypothetical protein K0R00_3587 [Herbinix sp.]|jgi:processed acidic surface protein|nr:hypothetical protein [Herbinix sp.]